MKVGDLKKVLAELPDDARVVVSAADHSHREAQAIATTALLSDSGEWTQDYGEEDTPERDYGHRVPVLYVF